MNDLLNRTVRYLQVRQRLASGCLKSPQRLSRADLITSAIQSLRANNWRRQEARVHRDILSVPRLPSGELSLMPIETVTPSEPALRMAAISGPVIDKDYSAMRTNRSWFSSDAHKAAL